MAYLERKPGESDIAYMGRYLGDYYRQQAAPQEPPKPQGVQLTQYQRDICAQGGISEADYIARYNQMEQERGRPVTQFVLPDPPAAPVVEDKPLTPMQQEVARWAGLTDDEYKESRAKINQQRGK
jgi:hypothetical protein